MSTSRKLMVELDTSSRCSPKHRRAARKITSKEAARDDLEPKQTKLSTTEIRNPCQRNCQSTSGILETNSPPISMVHVFVLADGPDSRAGCMHHGSILPCGPWAQDTLKFFTRLHSGQWPSARAGALPCINLLLCSPWPWAPTLQCMHSFWPAALGPKPA